MKQCQKTWLFIVTFNAIGVWKLNDWVALQMSSIINAAYWQRLFSMLSSNLIKMLRVKRNILIKIKFWSFVLKTLKYISIYRYFKLILNFRHGFKLSKDDSINVFFAIHSTRIHCTENTQCICALFTTSSLRHPSANLHTIYANLMWSMSRDFKWRTYYNGMRHCYFF